MITTDVQAAVPQKLNELRQPCPDMRLAQWMATLGMLGEDVTGRSLWDLEDEELAAALEKFASDLERRARA
jgi:hypothetical protein